MSLPLIMRFSLNNEDLLTAYNTQLDHVCKPSIRYVLITLGYLGTLRPIDKPLIWLPARVFESQETRDEFMNLAASKDKL